MATSNSSVGAIGSDQFLQLLVAQLQNQDPLDPISNQDFIAQLTSLNTVQSLSGLNTSFSEMLKLQQLTQGADLIGKTIDYTPPGGGATVTGKVDSVAAQNGQFVLTVGSDQVTLDQIQSVH
jgi:flagellar basal-body rod modification protein FlgD